MFIQVTDTKSTLFKQCLTIYHESFPVTERQLDVVIIERIDSQKCILYAGVLNAMVEGFAIVWIFGGTPFIFVDYLAVSVNSRGSGFGRQLLQFLSATIAQPGNFLVFEVEHPGFGDNRQERTRRINFYQRAGAVLLHDVRYVLPPLQENSEPIEMQLMLAPDPSGILVKQDLKSLIVLIYKEVYNRNAGDEVLQSLL